MDSADKFDVVVVGAGIAGVTAALEAAQNGAHVALASLGPTFSGSSFYGGTWGLGLVGPENAADIDDFVATVLEVGRGMANPELVRTLVEGVDPAVAWLEQMGVELRRPQDAAQREYVPCFDHKTRGWHGLGRASLRTVWSAELERRDVVTLPHTELLDIVEDQGFVAGALLANLNEGTTSLVPCGALVLATGGLAGLYERRLTADDTCGSMQGLALLHGASLVNTEFLQIMPGLASPVPGLVVNEKAFRFSTLNLPHDLLAERSGYGPFTSRLPSRAVDAALMAAGPQGLPLSYRLPDEPPEFVTTYFEWLKTAHGINPSDNVRATLFAHASNGGILIDKTAACVGGPTGLFACGECTGGMHGADRIGGLASASALVFGRAAGRAAAQACWHAYRSRITAAPALRASRNTQELLQQLRHTMSTYALVGRTEKGLAIARETLQDIESSLDASLRPSDDVRQVAATLRFRRQLLAATAMLRAMQLRTESRGAHERADHPHEDPRQAQAYPITRADLV